MNSPVIQVIIFLVFRIKTVIVIVANIVEFDFPLLDGDSAVNIQVFFNVVLIVLRNVLF